jgi:hypothetical protein
MSADGTIVMLASNGFVVRNYLLGRCADELLSCARVLALSPLHDDAGFAAVMARRGVDVAPLFTAPRTTAWARVRRWRDALHVAQLNTDTWRMKQSSLHHESSRFGSAYFRTVRAVAGLAASERTLRRFDRLEERHALASPAAQQYRQLLRIRMSGCRFRSRAA